MLQAQPLPGKQTLGHFAGVPTWRPSRTTEPCGVLNPIWNAPGHLRTGRSGSGSGRRSRSRRYQAPPGGGSRSDTGAVRSGRSPPAPLLDVSALHGQGNSKSHHAFTPASTSSGVAGTCLWPKNVLKILHKH